MDLTRELRWIDVSVPIRDGMVHTPGDPEVRVTRVKELERGDVATVSRLDMGAHTGTHIDAPLHFIAGAAGVEEVDLAGLIGPARVVAVPEARVIDSQVVESVNPQPGERLLFRTRNSDRCWRDDQYVPDYSYVDESGARRLMQRGVRTVGVDYLSLGGGHDGPETHRVLLSKGVCIIEGLNLQAVAPGQYQLLCLPLRIVGGDGAPARVLLGH